ncbi:MAG: hypothetical protein KGM15_14150, partial [Pseudomonadota bacterium]|nr:hypothetical protein [Pseudomonadota bacterium]
AGGRPRSAVAASPTPARNNARALFAVLAVGVAAVIFAGGWFALSRDRRLDTTKAVALTHGGGAATVVGATEDGEAVVLASDSPDRADWPIMPNAGHPDGDARAWRFTAGIRFVDGRLFYYRPTVAMRADLSAGAADVRAGDLLAPRGRKPVSRSPSTPASRDPLIADQIDVNVSDWRDDAADAPPICLKFTLDAAAKTFEPHVFCATTTAEGACGAQILGCGFFR